MKRCGVIALSISIPRALAGPDVKTGVAEGDEGISIPRALAGPDPAQRRGSS